MSVSLSEHLPLLAEAPDGIKKLRELILELGVRGKLVPQNPGDEPASELLKRIAAEKSRLVAEGKIRKDKPLAALGENGKPFGLPAEWEWVRFGAIAEKLTDGSHNPPRDSGSGIPMLSSQNVLEGEIDFTCPTRFLSDEDFAAENARTKIEPGDVLLTIVASIGRSAVVPVHAPLFALQRSVAVIRSALVPEFLSLQLRAPVARRYYLEHGKGTAQKGIYLGQLSEMPLSLPPLPEQHRIVAKVDELMALCDRMESEQADAEAAHATLVQTLLGTLTQSRDAAELVTNWQRLSRHFDTLFTTEASLDALKQTILQLAVMGKLVPQDPKEEPASELLKRIAAEKARLVAEGTCKKSKPMPPVGEEEKPFELPVGWAWAAIESLALVGTGTTPPRTEAKYFSPGTIPWVTSGETGKPFITTTAEKVSELAIRKTNLTVYPIHTLIIAMYGQGKTRGQISELLIEATTNQACAAIVLVEKNSAHLRYIKYFFTKSYDEIRLLSAGGAQPNLNVGKIKSTLISLPPLAEQHRIVAKVDELMALCDSLKADLAESRARQARLATTLIESALQAA